MHRSASHSRILDPALRLSLLTVLGLLLLAGCPANPDEDTSDDDDSDDDDDSADDDDSLPAGIHALDGIDAELPHDDLAPLGELIGAAPVVALGESFHTSGGFYRAKHRLFRYLVEEKGFRAFAFESPWTDAERVADYVADGTGDAFSAITEGLFGVWAAQATLDLLEWMRAYNDEHPDDPVAFWGFDIQQPWDDGPLLMDFVTAALPAQAAALNADIVQCNGTSYASASEYSADPMAMVMEEQEHLACLRGLDDTEAAFVDQEAAIVAATSADALAWGWISLVSLRAWEGEVNTFTSDISASYEARDAGMADVFLRMWALRNPGQKVAIWAHNWHISANADLIDGDIDARSMGTLLAEDLGDDYVPVGFTACHVAVNWPGVYVGEFDPPTDEDNVAVMLQALGHETLLVDLAFPGAETPFFEPDVSYQFGGPDMGTEWMKPAEQFRALLYLEESPAMEGLGW